MKRKCETCNGTGANPLSDNLNWLPCTDCGGSGDSDYVETEFVMPDVANGEPGGYYPLARSPEEA